ncbi:glycerate kinase I [Klebsiella pneumoniae subsp. ozaenae]|uniref:Glycerate kinase I n=1 Tax=Klebsiella pneumoniae subsp. ozaenae TaxID=574 RepID=A0A378AGU7_KLEPO|nr:glycerate kinase I [Klebsiella pneumoniae subsp. ozaenae]
MGAALMAFLNAELRSGIEIVTEALKLEEQIHDCSLVVTGEGRLDSQSVHGKVPVGVARVAKKYRKPVIGNCWQPDSRCRRGSPARYRCRIQRVNFRFDAGRGISRGV